MRLPHGQVEAGILLAAAWILALNHWRGRRLTDALLQESIVQLKETVNRWASGDLEARVYLDQEDPLDSLARAWSFIFYKYLLIL